MGVAIAGKKSCRQAPARFARSFCAGFPGDPCDQYPKTPTLTIPERTIPC